MLTRERHNAILDLLSANGRVLAGDLAERFGVSEDTARRDLRDLARAGRLQRVHGGALPSAPPVAPLRQRIDQNPDAKQKLGAAAAALVRDGQTLFIDAGSTNLATARALPLDRRLTVITNAPGVALALVDHPLIEVLLLGGRLDRESGGTRGVATVRDIGSIYADLYFLGSCAVDPVFGASAVDGSEAEVKRAMVAQSRAVAVAATSDKLGTAAPFRIVPPTDLIHLVVERDADPDMLARFSDSGTVIHLAS